MTAKELLRKLRARGATVDPSHGKGSHVAVMLNGRITYVPVHGRRELPAGTLRAILRQLGINPRDL